MMLQPTPAQLAMQPFPAETPEWQAITALAADERIKGKVDILAGPTELGDWRIKIRLHVDWTLGEDGFEHVAEPPPMRIIASSPSSRGVCLAAAQWIRERLEDPEFKGWEKELTDAVDR